MKEKSEISIVIVNYNVKDFLLQCLRSIESASKNVATEIIVADNNSSDGSCEFLAPLFPNVKFIQLNENHGFAKANNIGINEAKGKYILILNPDTILQEDTLDVMYDYMEKHTEVACAGCKVLNSDGSFQLACRRGFPTPWVSFTKLFGLQKLFPDSKLFSKYNQTFRSVDETYFIDSVIGAFMFCRKESLDEVQGFDDAFFMYGEDIDLCYRLSQKGWKTAYVHSTSIIHYKGESTRRSSINEIKHFYEAMRIFSKKHYSSSFIFLMFLRLGIILRTFLAYINKFKKDIIVVIFDLMSVNLALMLGTWYRFGGIFNFPDYAYPTVFIAVSLVMVFSMIIVGEYFETKPTTRRALFGLMISFFILSSLTYYFKDFAFSRGVLLMTIGLTAISASVIRGIIVLFEKTKGTESDRRIALVGLNQKTENIVNSLRKSELTNVVIVGVVSPGKEADSRQQTADRVIIENEKLGIRNFQPNLDDNKFLGLPVLGNIEFLSKIIENYNINELVITDTTIAKNELIRIIAKSSDRAVRYHVAQEFEELLASRIINEITGIEPTIPRFNINKLRFKAFKRLFDIFGSIFLLTIGLPVVYLLKTKKSEKIKSSNPLMDLLKVLWGKFSLVGQYELHGEKLRAGKIGLIGLVHISNPNQLSIEAKKNLNNFYLQEYSFSLDIDIIIKFLFRKKSGI
ncbi:MAG: glycosyltransferase [bacterium]